MCCVCPVPVSKSRYCLGLVCVLPLSVVSSSSLFFCSSIPAAPSVFRGFFLDCASGFDAFQPDYPVCVRYQSLNPKADWSR